MHRRPAAWTLALLAALAAPVDARLEPAEWKQVEALYGTLFTPPPGKPGFAADKAALVAKLLEDADSRSWRLLGEVLMAECRLWLDARRAVRDVEDRIFPTLLKPSRLRTPEEQAAMFEAQAKLGPLEEAARVEREILDAVVRAVTGGPPALRGTLFARARTSTDWVLRAAAAQVAAAQPFEKDAAAHLVRTLNPSSEKDARVRAAALDGLAAMPEGAEDHLIGSLGDPEWTVQVLAVRAVRAHKLVRAIPHLIVALERANARMQEEIGEALKAGTGENFDPFADTWAKWWAENKERFAGKDVPKVGGRPANPPQDVTLYGVPIKSDRVLFVIDVSGSMVHEITLAPTTPPVPRGEVTPREGDPPPPPEEDLVSGPKIEVAKRELRRAVERLPRNARFSMVAFNHAVHVWKDAPVPATPDNKEEAYKWIRALGPAGSTFVEGALRVAFTRIAGLGAFDKAYPDVAIDTIVLLCDGAPTDNHPTTGELVPYEPILEKVREWNARRQIVIHCIAIDMMNEIAGNEFLTKLAAENGGSFTPIPKPKPRAP